MKTVFIEAKSNASLKIPKSQLAMLPKKVGIITTIQHLHRIEEVKAQLPESVFGGQVLGCNASAAEKIKDKVDAFLYIGSGEFHPLEAVIETGKDVFCYNPFSKVMSKITEKDLAEQRKCKKVSLLKFYSAERVGILVSTKHGQSRLKEALELASKKDKEYHVFAFDTLNDSDLENFNFIQCWVNTACPRISDCRKNMLNISDIK